MADKKVSQLVSLTTSTSEDLLMIIDDPNGTPASKKITIKNFFGAVPANTDLKGSTLTVRGRTTATANVNLTKTTTMNVAVMTIGSSPSTNNATTEGWSVGQMRFSNTYLYIAVNATTIKRVSLSKF
jgi:hypothetical protein